MRSQSGQQQSQLQGLAPQTSLYSLTFDEFQNQLDGLGKPLTSMNLEELLKNVWSPEPNQAAMRDFESAPPQAAQEGSVSGLQGWGSVALNGAVREKTIDETWREIQQGQVSNNQKGKAKERQPTVGEMTLEDFLVKAGVVAEGSEKKSRLDGELKGLDLSQGRCNVDLSLGVDAMAEPQNFPQEGKCLRYQYRQHDQPQQQNTKNSNISGCLVQMRLPMNQNPPLNQSYSQNQMNIASASMGTTSNAKPPGRKRVVPGDASENMIDSKQKRMLKNREFAARSRAKKQAYKYELENKVSHLEEENERLKKQKEQDSILHCTTQPNPRYQLRRTSSAPL